MFIRKIEKHHWLQWNSVQFQMNNECTFLLRDSNALETLTDYCCTSQNNFSWNLLAAVDMLLMNWLLSSCLLEPVLNLSFPMMHYCTKTFFIFRNQIRIPRTSTISSEICYFVQPCQVHPSSNKNLLLKWPMLEWCHENDWWWVSW